MTIASHLVIFATSLLGFAAAVLTARRQSKSNKRLVQIEVLFNGERARLTARVEQLATALANAGVSVPVDPDSPPPG